MVASNVKEDKTEPEQTAIDSAPYPPVKTIVVASNVEEDKTEPEKLAIDAPSPNHSQDLQPKKYLKSTDNFNEEENNNNTGDEANIVDTVLSYVKRDENDEGAETDVSNLNEIIINSISKNVKEIIRILGFVSYEYRQVIRKKYQEIYSKVG